ncbi:angiotensin-converting enzyme [Microplitis demolitor]|uniref:angiotensin-converting enzyme n=1 Tax=Microplitis demolitor TaxID=69319 RepID=UPI0006D52597|nr:angiotensin-converting enzyme [Microplitis demolitor]XP_008546547.2 angiotensin-converting enzyme [Microplitis demolitor]XP_008546548.2 angiotensin-converting enzyme [Microplitis demolitor]XP_053593365.1 angiotensin-converting enzyme [Microplitis demolitor]
MNLKWCYMILSTIIYANGFGDVLSENANLEDKNISLQFIGLEYEDACFKSADSEWKFIQNPNNETLQLWKDSLDTYASIKRKCLKDIDDTINETLSSTIEYKLNLVSKPGDALLEPEDWTSFTSFIGQAELTRLTGNYTSGSNNLLRKNAEDLLRRNGNNEDKLKAWISWYRTLQPLTTKLSNNLQFVQKAAVANGAKDVTEYWEMLSEYKDGYNEAKYKWSEILSLYEKLKKFVRTRLTQKYNDLMKDEKGIPAYLLGSLESHDWTPLAMDVIPYPNYIYDIRKNLWEKNLIGKNLYKSASRIGSITLKHVPEVQFFDKSYFQGQCPPRLVNFCRQGTMSVNTCSESSLSNYLSAHKNIAKVLIHQMSEESMPIINNANRYSALEEGVSELFGILASSQAWLTTLNLINETDKTEEAHIVSIMITALDVLPRMAYYLTADQWRIDIIRNNTFDPDHLTNSWWEYRSEYENIVPGSSEKLPTFLDDSFIINNRPYLSKFIGTIIGFQIYEHIMESTEVRTEKLEKIPINHNFIKMIQHGSVENWNEAIKKYLQIYDVSVDSLLSYFSPFEEYLDELNDEELVNLPLELEKKLEILEDLYQKNLNNPITTTEAINSTTTVPTNLTTDFHKQIELPSNTKSTEPQIKNNSSSSEIINPTKIPVKVTEKPETIPVKVKKDSNDGVKKEDKGTAEIVNEQNNEAGKLIKSGMSKAVWAVGSVLIATIAIVIIAIFGRRRCRKTPKNRRYV